MPCYCWYDPPEGSKRKIKDHCVSIINEIKDLEKIGDPLGISLNETKKLLDHLYSGQCDERPK